MRTNFTKEEKSIGLIYNRITNKCFLDYSFNRSKNYENFATTMLGEFPCEMIARETMEEMNKPEKIKALNKRFGLKVRYSFADKRTRFNGLNLDAAYHELKSTLDTQKGELTDPTETLAKALFIPVSDSVGNPEKSCDTLMTETKSDEGFITHNGSFSGLHIVMSDGSLLAYSSSFKSISIVKEDEVEGGAEDGI